MRNYRLRDTLDDNLVTHLMLARGVAQEDHADFLAPDFLRESHDPFLLPDMEEAVERILAAKKNNERVVVWSDYDCDGIPGGVLLVDYFNAIGITATHYIPDRHAEGYGLNKSGIDSLSASLIVTVDLGTTDAECVAHAKQKGIDTIVTDHHLVGGPLPECLVINPKRPDSRYPFSELCGAGVAFKLVQAIQQKAKLLEEGQEKWLIDLAALGTLSDMVPLVGENRMLAHFGLVVMRKARRPGLAALLQLLRIAPHTLTEDDIGFMVAPRINAASRMGTPATAAFLLAAKDTGEATRLAVELQGLNDERKGLVAATVKEVNKRLAMSSTPSPVIVMGSPLWRPGILGLVASSVVESHHKPVFLWGREGSETIKGSCRSVAGVNVVEMMAQAHDVFDDFGGHTASGGFSINEDKIHELPARLTRAYEALSHGGVVKEEVVIDRELALSEVSHAHRELKKLAPFGVGNNKPLFLFPRARVNGARMFGKQQNHLEVMLGEGRDRISGIAFFFTPESFTKKSLEEGVADVVGHVETDWRSRPRIRIVDIL